MPSPIGPKKWNIRSFFSHEPKFKSKKGRSEKPEGFFKGVKKFFSFSKTAKNVTRPPPRATPTSAEKPVHQKTDSAFSTVQDRDKLSYIDVGERGLKPRPAHISIHEPRGEGESEPIVLKYIDDGKVDLTTEDKFFSLLENIVRDFTGEEAQINVGDIRDDLEGHYTPGLAYVPGKYFFEAERFHTSDFLDRIDRLDLNLNDSVDYIIIHMKNEQDRELATVLINKDRYAVVSNLLKVPVHLVQVDQEGDPTGIEIVINRHLKGDAIHVGFPRFPFRKV